jgi:hypothetical protein
MNCKSCQLELNETNQYKSSRAHLCKKCFSKYQVKKGVEKKLKLIQRHGGECQSCGYKGHYSVFDFHHLDPSKKEIQLECDRWGWNRLTEEADKCALLCSNCHRLVHAGEIEIQIPPCPLDNQIQVWYDCLMSNRRPNLV